MDDDMWSLWSAQQHIDEAQRLCEKALLPDQSEPASAIYLQVAQIHATIAVARKVYR